MKTSSQEYTDLLMRRYLPGRAQYLRYLIYPRILKRLKKGSVVDMGCGFGEFLKYLSSKSITCNGIDLNAAHVSMCNEMGLMAQVGDILNYEASNRFNNVILDNVLEHLDLTEIDTFFQNLRNFLAPQGRLIAIVPCLKGQARDPTHKTYVTKDLLLDFSTRHRMQLIETVSMPTPFDFIGKYFYLQMRMFVLDAKRMTPLVTVCLPVFNNAKHLEQAIFSIQKQTYSSIEVVAIDDCSSDGSYELLKKYESENFILLKNQVNLGMKGNWNKCVENSNGKYIKMMGADDILSPDCIAKQVEILESVDVDMVSSNRYIISDDGGILFKLAYPLHGHISPKDALRKLIGSGRNIIGEPVACLMRRSALVKIGGFSAINHYVIDIETWAKLFQNKGFYAADDFLCSFRLSNTSTSSKEGLNQIRSVFQFIASFQNSEIGIYTKIKGYFFSVVFGIIRNVVIIFSGKAT